ncbi:hypothetical protein P7C73_g1940, partial [Tremellales sp. Uapishka_1]
MSRQPIELFRPSSRSSSPADYEAFANPEEYDRWIENGRPHRGPPPARRRNERERPDECFASSSSGRSYIPPRYGYSRGNAQGDSSSGRDEQDSREHLRRPAPSRYFDQPAPPRGDDRAPPRGNHLDRPPPTYPYHGSPLPRHERDPPPHMLQRGDFRPDPLTVPRRPLQDDAYRSGRDDFGEAGPSRPSYTYTNDPSASNGIPTHSSSSGGYVPPHTRRHLQQTSSPPPVRHQPFSASASSSRRPSPSPAPPPVTLPPSPYIDLSASCRTTSTTSRRLLVLDLNGALVYRTAHTGLARKSYPRPYLSAFLEYLFLPEPAGAKRPWEVFVWSSAQPHNVRSMVEKAFGPRWIEGVWDEEDMGRKNDREKGGEGRLLGVWARDQMGLDEADYGRKVQTVKDLRKVHDHLALSFDESNTVLLDDSPLKGVLQPWNQVVVPEYDREEWQSSKKVISREVMDSKNLDRILLGVVGILGELKNQDNIPFWIRSGGLALPGLEIDGQQELDPPRLESLPSQPDFVHWYQIPEVMETWVSRGKLELERKGIKIHPGDISGTQPDSGLSRERASPPRRQQRRWSPSRPASPILSSSDRVSPGVASPVRAASPSRPASPRPPSVPKQYRDLHTSSVIDQPREGQNAIDQAPDGIDHFSDGIDIPEDFIDDSQDATDLSQDEWRRFRAVDISLYLEDVADRPSSLDRQARRILRQAGNLLFRLGLHDSAPGAVKESDGTISSQWSRELRIWGRGQRFDHIDRVQMDRARSVLSLNEQQRLHFVKLNGENDPDILKAIDDTAKPLETFSIRLKNDWPGTQDAVREKITDTFQAAGLGDLTAAWNKSLKGSRKRKRAVERLLARDEEDSDRRVTRQFSQDREACGISRGLFNESHPANDRMQKKRRGDLSKSQCVLASNRKAEEMSAQDRFPEATSHPPVAGHKSSKADKLYLDGVHRLISQEQAFHAAPKKISRGKVEKTRLFMEEALVTGKVDEAVIEQGQEMLRSAGYNPVLRFRTTEWDRMMSDWARNSEDVKRRNGFRAKGKDRAPNITAEQREIALRKLRMEQSKREGRDGNLEEVMEDIQGEERQKGGPARADVTGHEDEKGALAGEGNGDIDRKVEDYEENVMNRRLAYPVIDRSVDM